MQRFINPISDFIITIIKLLKVIILNFQPLKISKMHVLQPKHIKLKSEDVEKLLSSLNISPTQLPKIKINDPALPEGCEIGDVIKIERIAEGEKQEYFRVVTI
jgi:DNA-directed RNA polymerase subunit H